MIRFVYIILLALLATAGAEIIPADRRITWYGNCGVPGGIPARTTIYTTLNPGATATNINDAIAACPDDQVVYLSAGTYNLGSTAILLNRGKRVTLRGAGPGQTIINSTAASYGIFTAEYTQSSPAAIASGATKGSTQVIMVDTPHEQVVAGTIIMFDGLGEDGLVFSSFSSLGDAEQLRLITSMHKVTSVANQSGSDRKIINFSPAIPYDISSLSPRMWFQIHGPGVANMGIEDMTINMDGASYGIKLSGVYSCWVENVEITGFQDSGVMLQQALQCEIRHCEIHDVYNQPDNSDGYGVSLYSSSSFCLVEDNIFHLLRYGIQWSTASANAILFNFTTDKAWGSAGNTSQEAAYNANHGPHPMMNLFEGNVGEGFQNDGYHGSASHITIFRNWFNGINSTAYLNRKMVDLNRGSYYNNVVGNVLGSSTWGNNDDTITTPAGVGPFTYEMEPNATNTGGYGSNSAVIYRLGYPGLSNNGFGELHEYAWQNTTWHKQLLSVTDLASTASTTATSATGGFTAGMVGQKVRLQSGGSKTITGIATGNPATITTSGAHGFSTGDMVLISGVSDGTFNYDINYLGGLSPKQGYRVTVTGASTFTVPINCTVAATNGSAVKQASFVITGYTDTNTIELASVSGTYTGGVAEVGDYGRYDIRNAANEPNTYPDDEVQATILRHGNWDRWTSVTGGGDDGIVWDGGIADHDIPDSLYYPSKPSYFGDRPWPPFSPSSAGTADNENIPAGYRYENGVDPPSGEAPRLRVKS